MKKLLLFASTLGLFAAAHAFANPVQGDSWDTIRSAPRIIVSQSAYAEAFGYNGYFNACVVSASGRLLVRWRRQVIG